MLPGGTHPWPLVSHRSAAIGVRASSSAERDRAAIERGQNLRLMGVHWWRRSSGPIPSPTSAFPARGEDESYLVRSAARTLTEDFGNQGVANRIGTVRTADYRISPIGAYEPRVQPSSTKRVEWEGSGIRRGCQHHQWPDTSLLLYLRKVNVSQSGLAQIERAPSSDRRGAEN
jgi:hypothetical protein